jgi:hypothetical protein
VNPEKLSAGLGMRSQILRGNVKGARRVGLLHGNIDAPDPRAVHAHVRDDVAAFIRNRDVHRLANFLRFLFRRADDSPGVFQFHCGHASPLI